MVPLAVTAVPAVLLAWARMVLRALTAAVVLAATAVTRV